MYASCLVVNLSLVDGYLQSFKLYNMHVMDSWQVNAYLTKANFLFLEKQRIEFHRR